MDHSILKRATAGFSFALLVALLMAGGVHGDSGPGASSSKDATVSLCDGESAMTIPGLSPGDVLPRAKAQAVADEMLRAWRKTQGEERWALWLRDVEAPPTAPARASDAAPQPQAAQPTKFTARDQMLWKHEQDKWIAEGYKLYHSSTDLGGTIGVSCDMCHPNGSNTHPETYPKYQVQLKKGALLRDMINWCIQNPEKGKPLAEDDTRLRAVEAYILSTRKGVPLDPGRH
jgi:thiosulfate dehydrogenase